ncbi:MAG: methyltransferase, partial [Actinomycetota bacterium]
MVTWASLLDELTASLDAGGLDDPALDARRMVEAASGHDGTALHEVLDADVGHRAMAALDRMQARRLRGEPLQYVVGSWGFRTLDLFVDRRVLIPRPETEIVAGLALDALDRAEATRPVVVDLGTGSGAIALAVAVERPASRVWGTDRSAAALDVARPARPMPARLARATSSAAAERSVP